MKTGKAARIAVRHMEVFQEAVLNNTGLRKTGFRHKVFVIKDVRYKEVSLIEQQETFVIEFSKSL